MHLINCISKQPMFNNVTFNLHDTHSFLSIFFTKVFSLLVVRCVHFNSSTSGEFFFFFFLEIITVAFHSLISKPIS